MKLTIILPTMALAANAFARNVHVVGDLKAREIDPATMDPTKLSMLSVLKTAVPTLTGTELALPTGRNTRIGDFSAQWLQDLPPEFLVLLAQMYPTTHTSETAAPATSTSDAVVSETAAASSDAISSLSEETVAASSDASSSVSQETAAASSHASSSAFQETPSASVGASANASASQTVLTNSLQTVPTATSTDNGTQSTTTGASAVSNPVVSNSATVTGDHSTSKPSKPSSSQPASSAGAKNTVGTGSWSAAVGLSVAALFCLLA